MSETKGLIRKIDELGRVVIPIELRRLLNVQPNDPLEVKVQGDAFVLRKSIPNCLLCGSNTGLVGHNGYYICETCIEHLVQSRPACAFCGSNKKITPFRRSWVCDYCLSELSRRQSSSE